MADLTIRIIDEDTSEPVPGARVALAVNPLGGDAELLHGESDPAGECRMEIPLEDGQWALVSTSAQAPGYEPIWTGVSSKVRWWESGRKTVRLRKGPHIIGRVTDGEGRPVAGAEVCIGFKVRGGITSAPPQVGFGWQGRTTDEEGRFDWLAYPRSAAGRAKGEWVVVVQHPLHERTEVTDLPEREADEEGAIPLAVTLSSGLGLEGEVRGHDGEPIPDALVRLTPRDRQAGGPGDLRWSRTDGSGRFRLGGLLPRRHVIHAWADGFAPGSLEVDLPADHVVVLDLPRGSSLEGQVVDGHGKGLPGVEVQAWPSPPDSPGRAHTHEAGEFRISALPPDGEVTLHFWHPLHESRHEVRLPSEPLRIGFPLVDFRARLFSVESDRPLESSGQILFRRPRGGIRGIPIRRGGDAGPFSIRPGRHEMTAIVPGRRAKDFRVNIPEWGLGAPVEIWMSEGREVRGRTVDLEGHPLGGILVTAYGERMEDMQETLSNPSGEFLLGGLGPSFHITAGRDGWAPTILDDPSPEGSLVIPMGPGAILRGTVRGGDGDPVAGVEVQAVRWRGRARVVLGRMLTDPDGAYRFPRLPAGPCVLQAGRSSLPLRLSHGEDREVDIPYGSGGSP